MNVEPRVVRRQCKAFVLPLGKETCDFLTIVDHAHLTVLVVVVRTCGITGHSDSIPRVRDILFQHNRLQTKKVVHF